MKNLVPAFGYAIIQTVEAGKSEGGLHVVGSDEERHIIVRASSGHMQSGHLVPCELQPGDRVWLAPQKMVGMQGGQKVEGFGTRKLKCGSALPQGHAVILLDDVVMSERKAEAKH